MIHFHDSEINERLRRIAKELGFVCDDVEKIKTFLSNYSDFDVNKCWDSISLSTAQGAALLDTAYVCGPSFDGRYIYFVPCNSDTFLRYDTTQLLTLAASWEKMNMSTAQGAATLDTGYYGSAFDGRYVYFSPMSSLTYIRFDTTQSFTTVAAWEKISASTAIGVSMGAGISIGCFFDGRYIYYNPWSSCVSFVRFDTTKLFTNSSAWEKVSISSLVGASIAGTTPFCEFSFDGRYLYCPAYNSDTFLRFDTTKTFTDTNSWEKISVSSAQAQALANEEYVGAAFDGRYMYFCPFASTTVIPFLRFDTSKSFTHSSSWERMSSSTAQGAGGAQQSHFGPCFDGRFIYFGNFTANTMLRFDTTKSFTNSSAWERVAATPSYWGTVYDGKYIYFSPYNSDTFYQFLACPNKKMRVER